LIGHLELPIAARQFLGRLAITRLKPSKDMKGETGHETF